MEQTAELVHLSACYTPKDIKFSCSWNGKKWRKICPLYTGWKKKISLWNEMETIF